MDVKLVYDIIDKYSGKKRQQVLSRDMQTCEQFISKFSNNPKIYFIFEKCYFSRYRYYMNGIASEIWKDLNDKNIELKDNNFYLLIEACLKKAFLHIERWTNNIITSLLEKKTSKIVYQRFHSKLEEETVFNFNLECPEKFNDYLYETLSHLFKVASFSVNNRDFFALITSDYANIDKQDEMNEYMNCAICCYEVDQCICTQIEKSFLNIRDIFHKLSFEGILLKNCQAVLYSFLDKYICEICKDHENNEISCMGAILDWFENVIIKWGRLVFSGIALNQTPLNIIYPSFEEQFSHVPFLKKKTVKSFIFNVFIKCCQSRLFDIVIDFPSSRPILMDFHASIEINPCNREKFVSELKTAFKTRLLHPGVATSDVITAYITIYRSMKILDPEGFIIQAVCDPIRNYLTTRDDTIRCIIAEMTSDSNSRALIDLKDMEEFEPAEGHILDDVDWRNPRWKLWKPTPMGASDSYSDASNSDILGMMISIFDNNDLFVQEYQRMLARRLLVKNEINLSFEYRNLELLSLRFQDTELQTCEVMLKDIKDSLRLNILINSEEMKDEIAPVKALVLSKVFWPDDLGFSETSQELSNFKLPEKMAKLYDCYTKAYEKYRADRSLDWHNQLGVVSMEIELDNGKTVEHSVRPLQAAILTLFENRSNWNLSQLSVELDIVPSMVRKQIAYWINYGLIEEISSDNFALIEDCVQ